MAPTGTIRSQMGGSRDQRLVLHGLFYPARRRGSRDRARRGPAAGDNQLLNIQLNPSCDGPEASSVLREDLALAMVNGSTTYGDEADFGSEDPSFIDMSVQVGPGESIGLVFLCREVSAGDADGMLLRVTDLSSGTDYWFDLTQP